MNRILELENLIKYHKAMYYQGTPEIQDHEYDKIENELKKIDPTNKVLEIVGTLKGFNKKVAHSTKMLSLNKTYKSEELESWIGKEEAVSTLKIDGVSCSLIYIGGKLEMAKTRGNGSFGENITNKVIWISDIPTKVETKEVNLEVRGELYCTEENFFKISTEMEKLGFEKPTSQRNIVAGLMGRKENIEFCRHLSFKAFDVILEKEIFPTEIKKMKFLDKLKFQTPEYILHKGMGKVSEVLEEAKSFLSKGDYLIDGIVFTYNKQALHEELGATAHHPRFKMAFKFQGESSRTKIKEIKWSVSRNGILTPIGLIEPIELSGARISRVTLHNYGLVKQFNLKKGDEIEIIRSGEVIPKFLAVVKSSKTIFSIPEHCPSCSSNILIEDIRLYCSNSKCPGKTKESILNFIQKIGIEDLSAKRLDEMIKTGLIKDIDDIYKITLEDLLKLDKVKEKLATKLKKTIDNSKNADITTFLSSLGIQGGAYNKCEKVVISGFDTIKKIRKLDLKKLMEIDSFAEKSATEFLKSLKDKFPLIEKLLDAGFKFEANQIKNTAIKSKKICITGSLSMKRSEIEKILREAGAIIVNSVSKNTDILLTNEKEAKSSKFKKALELSIAVISEDEVVKMAQQ